MATTQVTLATVDDEVDEPNTALTLTVLDGDVYYPGVSSEDEVTVRDDDDAPTVTLVLTPASIGEAGGKSTVTATLDVASSEETTVTVAPVSPALASDYTLSDNLELTFAAGETTSTGEVTITAVDNDVDALDKRVTVSATAENTQGVTAPQNVTLTITDDDAPELSIGDASVTEGDAGESATLTFTVTLSPAATLPVTVDWKTADGTATAGTDYTAGNGTLTFSTGENSKTVTVTVTGDDADEPNETFTVTLSNAPGATLGDATGTGTITDDDGPPTVTLVLTPDSIVESGGVSTVTATLDHASSTATTVTVTVAPVDPAVSGDYTLSTDRVLTIPAHSLTSEGLVTITAVDNTVDALGKEVTVSATATNAQGVTAPQDVTLTIEDDDAPALSIADASVAEGDSGTSATLTFTVTLAPAATLPVTVDWKTADGTATAGTDYAAGNGTLTFEAGDATKTVAVTVTGDDADEPNETLTVTLSNESGATLADAAATGTITDDDGPPAVTLVLTPASIGENGGSSTVTATLDRPSSAATTVTVSATPVSPALAGDYALSTNKTLTIPADSLASTGVVTITAVDNSVDAADKTVTVSATATNAQGITAPQDATLTITDDDAPELTIADASVAEGDSGTSATLTFTVTLAPAATLPVTVDWQTADGTAEAGTDYTAGSGTLTFESGDASKTFAVTVTGDDADEPNETLTVTLSNESGATLADAAATGTITDDDGPPAVTLVLTPASIGENGGSSTVTATLDRASSAATTVTVSATPVSPAVAGDYALSTNKTLTIPADSLASTGVVTITAVDNSVDAADKTVTVSATATNAQGITVPDNVTLTITDDDAPSLSIADASVTEGDSGTSATLTFTVTLTPAATLPVTVDWKTADGTATAGTDYTAANGSLTFESGDASKTVAVTVTGDDTDEPNETITVTLSNAPGATITDATATGTITDDDGPPAVTLVLTPTSITENGGTSTVTATLDRASSAATTVTVSATPVSPALAGDYTLSANPTLTIAAGQTASTGEVTITAVNNAVDAADKTVTVSATATNTQGVTAPQDVTLTITDDDAPALSIGDASVAEGDSGESATLTFTVTLIPAATLPVTVDWKTADGTATAGADYTAANGNLSFGTGEDTKTISVPVTGDNTDEPNETITVTLSNAPGATITDATGTGTITDDDGPPAVTLVLTPASIAENGGSSTVTATLDHPSSEATTVTVTAAPVSPAVSGDYTLSTNKTLTIPADSLASTGVVTVIAVNNDVDAADKTVTVSATAENDQGITAPQNVTLTITDDDAPSLSIADASVAEGDQGTSATLTFTVTLTPAATLPVTVDWKTSDGTATAGTDYTAANGSLSFGTGEDTKTISVTVTGDNVDEPNETITVTLSNAPGATITDATATGTITDDDGPPAVTLVLTPASITENGGKSTVTATLDRPSSAATTVTVSAAPVTPAVSGDYTLSGSQLTIAAGQTTSTGEVTITAVNNDVDALDKTVTVSATATNTQGVTAPKDVTLTITDDDAPMLSIADASVNEGDSGESPTLTFTVTLTPAATLPVTVDWATSDGTAQAGTDYTAANGSLRFDTGDESKTITVTVTGDDVDEPNETFTVTLSNAPSATITDATGAGTITDDDGPPAVTLVLTPASIGEAGGKSTVTATLDRRSSAATTVTVTAAPVDPALASDYTLSGSQLTIAAGATTSTGEVTITAVDNDVDALDKMVTVSATAANDQGITAPQNVTLTITDDDAPALSIADASVTEGDSGTSATLTFTVTLTPAATLPVTVDWKTADGTAEAGTDYTAGNGTLTFNTGDESKTVTVPVTGDNTDEPNETLTVTLSNAPGATLAKATATGTITDDDGPPAVTLVLTPASIGEAGGTSTVTATLDRPSNAATTVTVAVTPVTPAVAGDYTLSGSQLTIPAGETDSTGVVTITAVNNNVDALDKEVTVSATAENDQGITAPDNVTLTITDDDEPALSVGDASVDEGDSGENPTLTFTVTLTPAATLPVTVDWKTSDGTAEAGTDYTAANGNLSFGTGEDTKTISVTVTGDNVDEPNETLTVTLSNAPGATLAKATATGTITDDDGPPAVTLVLTPASIGEAGGTSTVTATLDRTSSAATTVTVTAAPVDPALASDYTLSGSQLTIAAGATTSTGEVTITAVDNDVDALDKTVTVSATATNAQGVTAPQDVTLTITDDDAPELSIGDASVTEGNSGESPTLTFTVTLVPAATLPVTVDWKTADGTAQAGTDYTAGNGTLTFGTGDESKTFTVTVAGDDVDEPNETITVTLSNESGATLGDATGAGTITDDDGPPAVTLVLTPALITEAEGKSTVTATLDRTSSEATTVTVAATPVTPTAAGDYTLSTNKTLTIAAGATTSTGEVTITAVNNDVDALDKTVTVSATATNGQGITAPDNVTLTITDDDAPALSIADASVTEGDSGESATLTFTVTLSPAATLPVTVDWKTADGTATAGTDYTAGNGSLTFNNGEDSKTITVTVTGDDADEPNETFTVTLSNQSGATITDATATGTITDDDGPPAVTLVLTPASISENGGTSTVTATLDRPSNAATTVTVSAAPVSPAVAGDYTLSGSQLTIPANSLTSTGEVTITAVNNAVDALDKTVTVSATAANTLGVTAPDSVTLTITDDDLPLVTVAAEAATVTEGADAVFVLTRVGDLSAALDVTFAVADNGAVLSGGPPTEATFNANADTVRVTLATEDDQLDEPDATLTLTLFDRADYDLGTPSEAAVTVEDNDDDPPNTVESDVVVTVAPVRATITEGEDAAFTLTREGTDIAGPLVVGFTLTDPATVLARNQEVPTTATIPAGQTAVTVTLATEDDQRDEPNAVLTLTLDDGADHDLGTPSEAEVTVEDNDLLVVTVAAEVATVTEGEDAVFVLTRTGVLSEALEVSFTLEDESDVLVSKGPPTSVTFEADAATARVSLATEDDLIAEPDAKVVLTLRSGAAYRLGDPSTATVVVRDNDGLQVVTVRAMSEPAPEAEAAAEALATATEREAAEFEPGRTGDVPATVTEGEEAVFELRRTGGDVSAALTVELEVSERSERGGDMVPAASEGVRRVRFEAGASTSRFVVETVDDGVAEPDSELTVAVLRNGGFYEVGQPGTATLRVADAGGVSVLAQGRRAGAGALLRRHMERFSQLTSDVALERLAGGRRVSTVDLKVDDEGVSANGEIAVALPLEWDGWGSVRYSDLGGTADGEVWDVYAGADYLSADGRTAYGVLTGYEPGRVTAGDVRLEASHMQFGAYGAHRLNETLTVDGALGWGRGRGKVSLVEGAYPVTAAYRSKRIAVRGGLTGDFGWGGEGLRVEPQIDLLYAEEDLDAFTDDMGGEGPGERLWLARLGFGPKVTRSLGESTTHGKLRVNLDTHNLESDGDRSEEVSASVEVGHRWQIDERSSLDVSVSVDGLGSDWFSSGSVGLRYELRF